MSDHISITRLDASPPRTVREYLKENYSRWVKRHISIANFGVPLVVAARLFKDGFSWKILAAGAGAWAMVCVLVFIVVGAVLSVSGWWKIHTKVSTYVPAAILLAAAVLGYILVFNFY